MSLVNAKDTANIYRKYLWDLIMADNVCGNNFVFLAVRNILILVDLLLKNNV